MAWQTLKEVIYLPVYIIAKIEDHSSIQFEKYLNNLMVLYVQQNYLI